MYDYLYDYRAIITGVYDGDSVTADIDLGFRVWAKGMKLRLLNIDAPEIRGEARPEGLTSRDWLRERVLGKTVIVRTHKDKTEKYGRWLAEIILDNISINNEMVKLGYAAPY